MTNTYHHGSVFFCSVDLFGPTQYSTLTTTACLYGFVIVDGLQRVTAIQAFLKGEFKVFGKFTYEDLDNSRFSLRRKTIKVQVFAWRMKKDILKYYLLFNNGGTVHSKEEIQRVRAMLEDCKEKQ